MSGLILSFLIFIFHKEFLKTRSTELRVSMRIRGTSQFFYLEFHNQEIIMRHGDLSGVCFIEDYRHVDLVSLEVVLLGGGYLFALFDELKVAVG